MMDTEVTELYMHLIQMLKWKYLMMENQRIDPLSRISTIQYTIDNLHNILL